MFSNPMFQNIRMLNSSNLLPTVLYQRLQKLSKHTRKKTHVYPLHPSSFLRIQAHWMNNKLLSVIFNFIVAIIVAVVVLAVSLPIFFVVDYPRIREFTSPDTSTQCTVLDKTPASSNSCPVVNSCICEFCDITIYPMCSQLKDEIYLNRTGDLGSQSCCGHGYETSCNMGIFRSTCTATMTRC
jgi:hypothetical protein